MQKKFLLSVLSYLSKELNCGKIGKIFIKITQKFTSATARPWSNLKPEGSSLPERMFENDVFAKMDDREISVKRKTRYIAIGNFLKFFAQILNCIT